jgi:hypothetical protein
MTAVRTTEAIAGSAAASSSRHSLSVREPPHVARDRAQAVEQGKGGGVSEGNYGVGAIVQRDDQEPACFEDPMQFMQASA